MSAAENAAKMRVALKAVKGRLDRAEACSPMLSAPFETIRKKCASAPHYWRKHLFWTAKSRALPPLRTGAEPP